MREKKTMDYMVTYQYYINLLSLQAALILTAKNELGNMLFLGTAMLSVSSKY